MLERLGKVSRVSNRPNSTAWFSQPYRRLVSFVAGLLVCASLEPSNATAQNALGDLRQSVRSQPKRTPEPESDSDHEHKRRKKRKKDHHDHHYDPHHDDEDSFWGALLAPFVAPFVWAGAAAVTSPFWGPAHLVEDEWDRAGYFPKFPYEDGIEGYMMRDPWIPAEPRMWSLRLRGDYTDNFDSVSSVGGHVLFETSHRLGLDSEVRYFQQDLGGGASDELWMGDANIVFRFAQSPDLQMRAGVGLNWMADTAENDFGVNFTYGGDWYPVRPLVVSGELDIGRLGRATYFHSRLTGGLQWRRYEVFAGYDYLDVGTVQIQGLVSGVRLWY